MDCGDVRVVEQVLLLVEMDHQDLLLKQEFLRAEMDQLVGHQDVEREFLQIEMLQ